MARENFFVFLLFSYVGLAMSSGKGELEFQHHPSCISTDIQLLFRGNAEREMEPKV
jgi:hypothetical protein